MIEDIECGYGFKGSTDDLKEKQLYTVGEGDILLLSCRQDPDQQQFVTSTYVPREKQLYTVGEGDILLLSCRQDPDQQTICNKYKRSQRKTAIYCWCECSVQLLAGKKRQDPEKIRIRTQYTRTCLITIDTIMSEFSLPNTNIRNTISVH